MWTADRCNIAVSGPDAKGSFTDDEKERVTECLTPDRKSPNHPNKTIFVLGDCHVGVLMPALTLAVRGRFQIRHARSDGIGLFPHRAPQMSNAGRYIDLYSHILNTLREHMKHDDLIVVAMHAGNWKNDNGAIGRKDNSDNVKDLDITPTGQMERDLLKGIVEPAKGRLFIFGDWAYLESNTGYTSAPSEQGSTFEVDVRAHAAMQRALSPLLARHTRLHYVPLLPLFCEPGTVLDNNWTTTPREARCTDKIPGTMIQAYSNENHLNTVGSIYMWPYVCDALETELQRSPDTRGELWFPTEKVGGPVRM
jgi:hypothetical protein